MIQIQAPSIRIQPAQSSQPDWDESVRQLVAHWIHENQDRIPWLRSAEDEPPSSPLDEIAMSRLVLQVIHFARDFNGGSDPGHIRSDFRAQFLRALDKRWPGFAWVVMAERSGFEIPGAASGLREGVGAGIQIPLLGSRALFLENGRGQVVMKVLPIAGNYESLTLGELPDERRDSPDSGIIIRPSAELEASYRQGLAKAGFRFLAQPRLDNPHDTRMLAEVYVELGLNLNDPLVRTIHIVPRCMVDFSTRMSALALAETGAFHSLYTIAGREAQCTLSTEFVWGL